VISQQQTAPIFSLIAQVNDITTCCYFQESNWLSHTPIAYHNDLFRISKIGCLVEPQAILELHRPGISQHHV